MTTTEATPTLLHNRLNELAAKLVLSEDFQQDGVALLGYAREVKELENELQDTRDRAVGLLDATNDMFNAMKALADKVPSANGTKPNPKLDGAPRPS